MQVRLIESETANLYPFNSFHLNSEIKVGAFTLIERLLKENIQIIDYKTNKLLLREKFCTSYPFVNQSETAILEIQDNILINNSLISFIENTARSYQESSISFKFNKKECFYYNRNASNNIVVELSEEPIVINYLWDAIDLNEKQINEDFESFGENFHIDYWLGKQVACVGYPHIHIAEGAKISPFVVLNAENGAIIIDENAVIMPHSTIIGPCYIGKNTIIKTGAKVYGNTTIGDFCKVGGEVEGAIFQGYSNKQHDGFLGHSFVGEWVNIGADTNTSDLKNTYGSIRVEFPDAKFDSGRTFLGTLFGDHAKTGINTMLNSGTAIGLAANVFGGDFPPKGIPAFSFGGKLDSPIADLERTIRTAETVMQRRGKAMSEIEREVFREEYKKSRI